jgi:integrase
MARQVRHSALTTKAARERLGTGPKVHWRDLVPGKIALGYRRRKPGPGEWLKRSYLGKNERGGGRYKQEVIGLADDFAEANDVNLFDYAQAQARALGEKKITGPLTVRAAMADYVAFLKSRDKDTSTAEGRISAFVLPTLGERLVDELTAQEIRDWHKGIADSAPLIRSKKGQPHQLKKVDLNDPEVQRRRKSSANRILTILKAGLNHAFDEERVASNEAWGRRLKPFEGVDGVRTRYLSLDEAKRLVNACEPSFRLLVRAALETGARYAELTRLIVSDFNPDSSTIYIRRAKSKRTRDVILSQDGAMFFREITLGRNGNELIFKNESRVKRSIASGVKSDPGDWRPSEQNRPMQEALERAKIEPAISFHGLRHSWASHSVMNGVPLIVVAKNLGHRDTLMVERHYGHLAPSHVVDAIRAGAPRYGFDEKPTNVRKLRVK